MGDAGRGMRVQFLVRELRSHMLWSIDFPYFLQCKSEFGNKEFMI